MALLVKKINYLHMKKQMICVLLAAWFFGPSCTAPAEPPIKEVVEQGLEAATRQALLMAETLAGQEGRLPKTLGRDGRLQTSGYDWWCSGFYPGELWYLYENTPTPELKKYAEMFTARVEPAKDLTSTHDVGFMLYCSFGNGYRLTQNPAYKNVLVSGSNSLITRYDSVVGAIRSWDFNKSKWQFPVIIDNMMNLEMLTWASRATGDGRYRAIAESHADVTRKSHFRDDYSCYHVVSYDTLSGVPHCKQTHQGAADSSAWARGQAWALYGYTMMYRETGKPEYLEHARKVADFILHHPALPEDKVPYWDFDAPGIPDALRDASAAAVMASAFLELSTLDHTDLGNECRLTAEKQLRTLTSERYLAAPGTNGNFALMHSVGSLPGNSEVDVPLSYADYYYVEALMRLKKMLK